MAEVTYCALVGMRVASLGCDSRVMTAFTRSSDTRRHPSFSLFRVVVSSGEHLSIVLCCLAVAIAEPICCRLSGHKRWT